MDHLYIEEQGIAARYLMDTLPVEERLRFEEHFIDCEACLDQLDRVEDCRQAMQKVAAGKAATASGQAPAGLPGRLAQLGPVWQVALFLSPVLLLVLSSLFVLEIRRLRQELNQVKAVAARQPAFPPTSTKQESPAEPDGRDDESDRLLRPQANIPIFSLSSVRGGTGPVNEIEAPNSARWIVFSLGLDDAPEYQTYRARILTAGGRLVWRESRLQPDHNGALTIIFPSTFFRSGDYLLELEGLSSEKQFVAVANYPFRVIKKNF
ncbi:MAG: hypothetical protein ACREAM_22385 [Blastocatellia bacterium]